MDGSRFDDLARSLVTSRDRRRVLGGLLAGALGLAGVGTAFARSCTAVGLTCREHANCCERICGEKDATGRRQCVCPPGKENCRGNCKSPGIDYLSDIENCGHCAVRCLAPLKARATCSGGTCGFVCNAGYRACGFGCIPDVPGSCCGVGECPSPASGTCEGSAKCVGNVCGFAAQTSGTVCRAATADCELDAKCNGTSLTCPVNPFAPSTTVCRASTGPCDPEERCPGTSNACPSDIRTPEGEQGACQEHYVCISGACTCTKKTCDDFPNSCGTIDDGCGGTIDCGNDCARGNQFANQTCINNVCSCAGGAVPCAEGCFCIDPTDSSTDVCVFSAIASIDSQCSSNSDCGGGQFCGSSAHRVGNYCQRVTFTCPS